MKQNTFSMLLLIKYNSHSNFWKKYCSPSPERKKSFFMKLQKKQKKTGFPVSKITFYSTNNKFVAALAPPIIWV